MARRHWFPSAWLLLSGLTVGVGIARGQLPSNQTSPQTHGSFRVHASARHFAANHFAIANPTGPSISALPPSIDVGDNFLVQGSGFTSGSVVNFFVATSTGAQNFGPMVPSSALPNSLLFFVPITVTQGEGVVNVQVVNTDQGHIPSNNALTFLQGDASLGLPSLTGIDGASLSPTSLDPGVALSNVETVVVPGATVTLTGKGFDVAHGVGINLFCACPGGNAGPFVLFHGDPGLSANTLTFNLPSGPFGPATGPGAFQVVNLIGDFFASAAVSVPIGARIGVSSVSQDGSMVTVTGAGFSVLTVINLFNLQNGTVRNLGGLNADGSSKIPLTVDSDTQFSFTLPTGAARGPAYVQALNPPFIPFTSSGNSRGGSFQIM